MSKIRAGLTLTQEAHDALAEMASGPRGRGEVVSALIIQEWERRQSARLAIRVKRLEQDFENLEHHLKERGVLLAIGQHRGSIEVP